MSGQSGRWVGLLGASLLAVGIASIPCSAQAMAQPGPVNLEVDNLELPLGIDDLAPAFSWQLFDSAQGAHQTAYELAVASSRDMLEHRADIWSSGRVQSAESLNVRYAGPALKPFTRYFWSIRLWGADGKPYSTASSWFETGLLNQNNWKAAWIGFETKEEAAVRRAPAAWIQSSEPEARVTAPGAESHIAYRATVALEKPVSHATLNATGQDSVSAWINGKQVLKANPFPAWRQMPWKKFVRADVTSDLKSGSNTLAIETVRYTATKNEAPPMISTLYVEYADGSTATFASQPGWKCAYSPARGWEQPGFNDTNWNAAEEWKQTPGPDAKPLGHPWVPDSVKALRHSFAVSAPVRLARLYATALGAYEIFLNGKRVGEDVLAPGWTDYRERVTYQTYDVTSLLAKDANVIGALLAPGWYSTPLEWFQQPNNYGDTPPALRAQLRLEHTDGSVEWITTDSSWEANESGILSAELYDGEVQDGTHPISFQGSWTSPLAKQAGWPSAISIEPRPVVIQAQDFQPIRIERQVPAKSMSQPKPGIYIFDFGQNLAGVERLRVSGPKGTSVRVRFAEILNDDGTLYTENLRTAKATDTFVLSGNGVETFTPQFTFHGFRYAEITGLPQPPASDALTALVMHTEAPFAAQLTTGSKLINQLWNNILWGQRSNFVGLPTDCPQRDERLGWMADAQVFWRTASYNMDLAAFSRKFSADMRGTQAGTAFYGIYAPGTVQENAGWGAGWSDAGVIIPWTSWLQTGDSRIIEQNWNAMTKYVSAIQDANPDGLWQNKQGIPFGDWLAPEGKTDQTLIATAEWAYDVSLLQQMAHATGRTSDEQLYRGLFEKIRSAFQQKFVHDDGFVAGADRTPSPFGERNKPTESVTGDTQTGYVLALHMNLLPESLRSAAAQKLAGKIEANHGLLATGFLGTPYLLEELTKAGYASLAYQLLLNTEYPSWGYLVQHGATTTWERWNGDQMKSDPSMNSYNHYAYGAVADWIYRYAAGIDATSTDAGFHTVVLHPVFDKRLGSVAFTYPSPYGTIRSAWNISGNTATWEVAIPANATGWLELTPAGAAKWKLNEAPLGANSNVQPAVREGQAGYKLVSGSYTFKVEL
ncbi:rhamnosidase [Acidobacteria bacterium AB60]|nr:rhamnosidase [Acidobacteria bacterium AB60]